MKTIPGLFLLLASLPAFAQSEIAGICHVVAADTVHVIDAGGTITVQLLGIAAPDPSQPGGKEAMAFLERYAEGKPVRCVLDGTSTGKREVGICYVEGKDIAAAVIRAGWARDCPAVSKGRYRPVEKPESQKLPLPDHCTVSATRHD